jgi:hypothetical protein
VTLLLEFGIGNVKIIKKRILVSISRIYNVQIPIQWVQDFLYRCLEEAIIPA